MSFVDTSQDPLRVVGIGASAGGLAPLQEFFGEVEPGQGFAYLVVQHLSPDFKSLMGEVLGRRTSLSIALAEHGMEIEADTIYLNQPRKNLRVVKGRLQVDDADPEEQPPHPIDILFRSLAEDYAEQAVGIVLSGTGSDGAEGLKTIEEVGGSTAVQSPISAQFDGMPCAALKLGASKTSLSPSDLVRWLEQVRDGSLVSDDDAMLVHMLAQRVRRGYGLDLNHYKPAMVLRRLRRRAAISDMSTEAYLELLNDSSEELDQLYHDLLIGVTQFFRDPQAFDNLRVHLRKRLFDRGQTDREFRAWVPACASGEEVYSLALLLNELNAEHQCYTGIRIFGNDINERVLRIASKATYPVTALECLSEELRNNYFTQEDGNYRVIREIRDQVVFAKHDILLDPPFTRMDLVSCRNMLIYLNREAQHHVLEQCHYALNMQGLLFLGPSESLGELDHEFSEIDNKWRVFSKVRRLRNPSGFRNPRRPASLGPTQAIPSVPSMAGVNNQLLNAYDALLERFAPAGLLIDRSNQLVHVFGDASKYLRVQVGRPSGDVMDSMDEVLRRPVSAALLRVRQGRSAVKVDCSGLGGEIESVHAAPLRARDKDTEHVLLTFATKAPGATETEDKIVELRLDASQSQHIQDLELELSSTRDALQLAREYSETTAEELQSTNEELQASNEELQSTNEELQSVNEELYTVNAEYQQKILELSLLTNDIENLLRSSELGALFVDRDLNLRKYTHPLQESFHLLPEDIGRRLDLIRHPLIDVDLSEICREVLNGGRLVSTEVRRQDGGWMLMRGLPYRSEVGELNGVVLTFTPIDELIQAQLEAKALETLTMQLDEAISVWRLKDPKDARSLMLHWHNPRAAELLGASEDIRGRSFAQIMPGQLEHPLYPLLLETARSGVAPDQESCAAVAAELAHMKHLSCIALPNQRVGLVVDLA